MSAGKVEAIYADMARLLLYPIYNPVDWLAPSYFPEQLERGYGISYSSATIPGYKLKAHQFVGGEERTFSLSLLFDSENRGDADEAVTDPSTVDAWFDRNVPTFGHARSFDIGAGLEGEPVFRLALFRGSVAFDVLIKRAETRTARFSKLGRPMRVTAQLELVLHDPLVFRSPFKRVRKAVRPSARETGFFSEIPGDFAGWVLTPKGPDAEAKKWRESYLTEVNRKLEARNAPSPE